MELKLTVLYPCSVSRIIQRCLTGNGTQYRHSKLTVQQISLPFECSVPYAHVIAIASSAFTPRNIRTEKKSAVQWISLALNNWFIPWHGPIFVIPSWCSRVVGPQCDWTLGSIYSQVNGRDYLGDWTPFLPGTQTRVMVLFCHRDKPVKPVYQDLASPFHIPWIPNPKEGASPLPL